MIASKKHDYSVRLMCDASGVSREGFRKYERDEPSETDAWFAGVTVEVERVWEDSNRIYGSRRVHAQLEAEGIECCEKTVRKVMGQNGWSSVHPAPWRYRTQSDATPPAPDLLGQDFTADRPGVRFVGDITQIDTWEGPLYLATVIDLYSKEVVGWATADNYAAELVCAAIVMARQNRRTRRRAVFHSDRGSQYTSKPFRKCLKTNRMRPSMGRVGTAYDNALAESFFASLKKEVIHPTVLATRDQAEKVVANYIEIFYNQQRLHSGIGYQTPASVRANYKPNKQAA